MFDRYRLLLLALCAATVVVLCAAGSAVAAVGAAQWTVTAISSPTNIPAGAGSTGVYEVEVQNTGGAASDGSTITVTDALPNGLVVGAEGASGQERLLGSALSCAGVRCTYAGVVVPDDALVLKVPVEVAAGAPGSVTNRVSVSGGGAAEGLVETPTAITSTPASFGIAPGSLATALSSDEAGGHPDLSVDVAFSSSEAGLLPGDPKETVADLPPGFVGDLADTPTCSPADFSKQRSNGEMQPCPLSTQVGTTTLTTSSFAGKKQTTTPVYNLTPNPGEVARLGFFVSIFGIQGTVSLRPGDYGVRTTFQNINETILQLQGVSLSIWGVPSDPGHDAMRGLVCSGSRCEYYGTKEGRERGRVGYPLGYPEEDQPQIPGQSSTTPAIPYLTSPTQCTGTPLVATFSVASWENPTQQVSERASVGPLTGCNLLAFDPAIAAAPDTTRADSPAGFTFEVRVPQEGLVNPEGLSTADIQNTTVTLPVGVAINPGQANGLAVCQPSQAAIGVEGPPSCPSNSRVGHVEIETPLLKRKLEGEVYVLASNPPDLKLLVVAADPADGIYVKLQGDVHLNETTGQLVTTFLGTPELPFSDFKLSFSGGAQAALVTPGECGPYTTNADFTPWSGESDALVTSTFGIEAGPGGSACASPLPFSPSLDAGATTDQAGGFTNFSLLLSRGDGQQRISTLQFKTPEGLLGMISKVPLCGEPQAAQGTCSAASQIGHTVVEAGPGPYPLVVPQPGQPPAPIYLTGGYKGAPYGLSIVVPLVVGPFNLGTIVTRARIEVDPHTSQLTVTTDPLPSIVDGVPSDLRTINAVIDRPGFMFNPTSCAPASFSGTATSTEGATAPISSHFQVGSCQSLKFAPDFKVSTSGKTSKANGASLDAKVIYPTGPLGDNQASSQSNIARVKVELPKQLPSRLTTLQKACTAAQFEANPGGCPAASVIGIAKAVTPVLPVPLTGPVYFVSHGGEAFPSLIVVLQGYGVTVDLVGTTFISKAGITSSTFKTVPDVPIYSFELYLPEGQYSALAANGNLCTSKLVMPTEFVAQDGAVIHQSTKIGATGCAKKKSLTRAQKLAAALRLCRQDHSKAKRQRCVGAARKKYGPAKTKTRK